MYTIKVCYSFFLFVFVGRGESLGVMWCDVLCDVVMAFWCYGVMMFSLTRLRLWFIVECHAICYRSSWCVLLLFVSLGRILIWVLCETWHTHSSYLPPTTHTYTLTHYTPIHIYIHIYTRSCLRRCDRRTEIQHIMWERRFRLPLCKRLCRDCGFY